MTSKRNSTKQPETIKPVVTDNQHNERKSRLMALGVPSAVASDFPLTPHEPTRRWCKKLKTPHGPKIFYFGPLDNWQTALEKYNAEKADLIAGRAPESRNTDGLRLLDLMNRFLHFKRGLVDCGELTLRSWYDYQQTG